MAGPRQPIELIIAKGKKNITKKEIADRRAHELSPCADDLTAPTYLTAAEKSRFNKIAAQLKKLKVMGETDTETLARYVTAELQYEKVTKELRAAMKNRPNPKDEDYYANVDVWVGTQERLAKLQDRYFKQAHTTATALGLTISARCKLVVPEAPEAPKENKFAKFGAG